MKVFLVDDSAVIRDRLKRILGQINHVQVVGESTTAQDATDSILQLKPEVVLLDIQLAKGSGIDVLRGIKHQAEAPTVIVLTNYPYPEFRNKYIKAGADYFFDKSTEFNKLVPVLNQLVEDEYPHPPQ